MGGHYSTSLTFTPTQDLNAASAKLIHYERLRKENKDMKLQLER